MFQDLEDGGELPDVDPSGGTLGHPSQLRRRRQFPEGEPLQGTLSLRLQIPTCPPRANIRGGEKRKPGLWPLQLSFL